jgi:hypothetical protein
MDASVWLSEGAEADPALGEELGEDEDDEEGPVAPGDGVSSLATKPVEAPRPQPKGTRASAARGRRR